MSPKEKAEELITNMYNVEVDNISQFRMEWEMAKQCALICVDEIIKVTPYEDFRKIYRDVDKQYWQQVKQELNKL